MLKSSSLLYTQGSLATIVGFHTKVVTFVGQ